MSNPHLDVAKVGDLLWFPEHGGQSPIWILTRFVEFDVNGEDSADRWVPGQGWIRDCVELLDLEDCRALIVARCALNSKIRIL